MCEINKLCILPDGHEGIHKTKASKGLIEAMGKELEWKTIVNGFECPYDYDSCGLHCSKFVLGNPNRCKLKDEMDNK